MTSQHIIAMTRPWDFFVPLAESFLLPHSR
jgi:hypothetical protein